jgi:hypothetical protein
MELKKLVKSIKLAVNLPFLIVYFGGSLLFIAMNFWLNYNLTSTICGVFGWKSTKLLSITVGATILLIFIPLAEKGFKADGNYSDDEKKKIRMMWLFVIALYGTIVGFLFWAIAKSQTANGETELLINGQKIVLQPWDIVLTLINIPFSIMFDYFAGYFLINNISFAFDDGKPSAELVNSVKSSDGVLSNKREFKEIITHMEIGETNDMEEAELISLMASLRNKIKASKHLDPAERSHLHNRLQSGPNSIQSKINMKKKERNPDVK